MFKHILLFYLAITATSAYPMQSLRSLGARLRASYAQASGKLRGSYNQTTSLVPSRMQARSHGSSRFSPSYAKATKGRSSSSRAQFSTLNSYRSFAPRLAAGIAIGVAGYTAVQATGSSSNREQNQEPFGSHATSYTGAFVLPYHTASDGKTYVLLGRECCGSAQGTWGMFGGTRDAHENNPTSTATREFHEEACLSYTAHMSKLKTYRLLNPLSSRNELSAVVVQKNILTQQDAAASPRTFENVTFVVNFKDIPRICKNFHAVRQGILTRKPRHWWVYTEMDEIALVSVADLQQAVTQAAPYVSGQVVQKDGSMQQQWLPLREATRNMLTGYFSAEPVEKKGLVRIFEPIKV